MKTIIWKGIIYNSLEYFTFIKEEDAFFVKAKIIGTYEDKIYIIDYHISIDPEWKVKNFQVLYEVNNTPGKIIGEKNDNDEWKINGVMNPAYAGFNFIDITLTPFTNTLPIKNLFLNIGQEQEIQVMYINILENDIKPVKQKYRRIAESIYTFENIPNDFEADLQVDEAGLVVFYPTLFERLTER